MGVTKIWTSFISTTKNFRFQSVPQEFLLMPPMSFPSIRSVKFYRFTCGRSTCTRGKVHFTIQSHLFHQSLTSSPLLCPDASPEPAPIADP